VDLRGAAASPVFLRTKGSASEVVASRSAGISASFGKVLRPFTNLRASSSSNPMSRFKKLVKT